MNGRFNFKDFISAYVLFCLILSFVLVPGLLYSSELALSSAEIKSRYIENPENFENSLNYSELLIVQYQNFQTAYDILAPFYSNESIQNTGFTALYSRTLVYLWKTDDLDSLSQAVIDTYPEKAESYSLRGVYFGQRAAKSSGLSRLNRGFKALKYVNKALDIDPSEPLASFTRGVIFYHHPFIRHRLKRAVTDFKRALLSSLYPELRLEVYIYLVLSLEKSNSIVEARNYLNEALAAHPHDPRLHKLQKKILFVEFNAR